MNQLINGTSNVMLLKITVATEVSFYLKHNNASDKVKAQVLSNMIRAYDMPDEWWDKLDKQRIYSSASSGPSVAQWAELFYYDPYEKYLNEPRTSKSPS